jgi:hypothetical protein
MNQLESNVRTIPETLIRESEIEKHIPTPEGYQLPSRRFRAGRQEEISKGPHALTTVTLT